MYRRFVESCCTARYHPQRTPPLRRSCMRHSASSNNAPQAHSPYSLRLFRKLSSLYRCTLPTTTRHSTTPHIRSAHHHASITSLHTRLTNKPCHHTPQASAIFDHLHLYHIAHKQAKPSHTKHPPKNTSSQGFTKNRRDRTLQPAGKVCTTPHTPPHKTKDHKTRPSAHHPCPQTRPVLFTATRSCAAFANEKKTCPPHAHVL